MKKNYLFLALIMICGTQMIAQTQLPASICGYTCTLAGSPYIADGPVTVGNGCTLKVEPGVEIRMGSSAFLIIKGKGDFLGTLTQPIRIHGKNGPWGLIYLDNGGTSQKSTFRYVTIEDATTGPFGNTHMDTVCTVAAICGNNATAEIDRCVFKNNLLCLYFYNCHNTLIKNNIFEASNVGEKIHVEMSNDLTVDRNTFYYTAGTGDVIDFDSAINGVISNNTIYGGESDGIDIGNSPDSVGCNGVRVNGNFIYGMGDKGVSVGEHCKNINVDHNLIVRCDVGISAKAKAKVVADHNTFFRNRIGVRACECLPGWGPGDLKVTNCIIAASTDSTWSVGPTSTLITSYSLSDIDLIPGTGNLKGNPQFFSAIPDSSGDFHIKANSAAIDKGNPTFATDPNGSRNDVGAFYFGSTVGIVSENQNKNDLNIYPNPADNSITILLTSEIIGDNNSVIVSDILGREISRWKLSGNKSEFDVSTLSPGIYNVRIISGEETKFSKKIAVL